MISPKDRGQMQRARGPPRPGQSMDLLRKFFLTLDGTLIPGDTAPAYPPGPES